MIENIYWLKIFNWFDKSTVDEIIENCEIRKYHEQELIIIEWEDSNGEWYIIKSWKVSVWIDSKKVAELSSWDIFWEIALLNEEERTASVIALTDIEVIVLKQEDLITILGDEKNNINNIVIDRIEENLK